MSLKHDKSTAAKMVACSELIRRLEQRGIDEVLPETAAVLDDDTDRVATAYIKIEDDGPAEYEVVARDDGATRRGEDDVHPQSYAFSITISTDDDLAQAAITAARARLAGLFDIHGGSS